MEFGRITKNTQMITGAAAVTLQAREHLQKATTPHPLSPQPSQSTHTGHQEQRHRTRPPLYTISHRTASTLDTTPLVHHFFNTGQSKAPHEQGLATHQRQTRHSKPGRAELKHKHHRAAHKRKRGHHRKHKQRCRRHRAHPQRQLRSCPEFHQCTKRRCVNNTHLAHPGSGTFTIAGTQTWKNCVS